MQTILWAIGSMVVLMIIIFFLPLGYSLRGKFFVVIASFILALGGLAAASTFPLWQTALMLFGLIFFTAYFMNNRMGALINQENAVFEEVSDEEFDYHTVENLNETNFTNMEEVLVLLNSSPIMLEKETVSELNPSPTLSKIKEIANEKPDVIDEDISFLLDRNNEIEVIEELEETNLENGYLSEIESLLEMASDKEELSEEVEDNVLEELNELATISFEDKELDLVDGIDEESLDDSLFDFLLSKKEAAADRDDTLEEIDLKKQVSMLK